MAEFIKDSQLVSEIESLIDNAAKEICLISPYIKLHERVKSCLNRKKDIPDLHLIIVFGKNADDAAKSMSREDFEYLKSFPNVTIGYEKRLHAKYYSSENCSIICSMNLYEFSQNNNIEVGIKFKSKLFSSDNSDLDASDYFEGVVHNSQIVFDKQAKFSGGIIGIGRSYTRSEIVEDNSEAFFSRKEVISKKYSQRVVSNSPQPNQTMGYCIRTGKQIPFDLKRPMCLEAYRSWEKFKNFNYSEKYCHKTGKPSNGKTSMSNPVLY